MKFTTLTIFKVQKEYRLIQFARPKLLQVATSHEYMTRSCFRKRTVPSFPMGSPSKANKTSFACSFKRKQGPFRERVRWPVRETPKCSSEFNSNGFFELLPWQNEIEMPMSLQIALSRCAFKYLCNSRSGPTDYWLPMREHLNLYLHKYTTSTLRAHPWIIPAETPDSNETKIHLVGWSKTVWCMRLLSTRRSVQTWWVHIICRKNQVETYVLCVHHHCKKNIVFIFGPSSFQGQWL